MFSEKIDYEKIRRLMLSNLEELHSEVFQMREEIRQLHAWNAVMFKFIYNEQYEKFVESRKGQKKSKYRFNKVLDDMIEFDKALEGVIKEARSTSRKEWKEKISEYKADIK